MEMGGELVWQWTVTQRAPRYRAAVALIFEKLLFIWPGQLADVMLYFFFGRIRLAWAVLSFFFGPTKKEI